MPNDHPQTTDPQKPLRRTAPAPLPRGSLAVVASDGAQLPRAAEAGKPPPGSLPPLTPLTDDRPVRRFGLLIILAAFGLFGGWSALAELDSVVVAPGVVTVESHRKTVQHLEGGIVKAIRVDEGDRVAAGDVLLELDETKALAELEVVRSRYFSALAREARLQAERSDAPAARFPDELLAEQDPRAQEAMTMQEQLLDARRDTFHSEIAILEQRVDQLKTKAEGLESLRASKETLERSYREEAVELKRLFEKGMTDKLRLRQLQRSAAEAGGEAGDHAAAIASTGLQINETRQQILRQRRERLSQVTDDLQQVQAELFDLRERLNVLGDSVARARIVAPASGIVLGLAVHTIGAVIQPGTRILDIVPQDEPLVVDARVPPAAIDKVRLGVAADIRFTAFSARTTPVVAGHVSQVSADRLDEQGDGVPYYLVRITADADGERGFALVPGMPAEVVLKTGKRTLFSYLAQPLTDAVARSFTED
ncbi:HlyD family type I secretion periplasmic adaptor subunit [Endothiovibrio diazotrophicus]